MKTTHSLRRFALAIATVPAIASTSDAAAVLVPATGKQASRTVDFTRAHHHGKSMTVTQALTDAKAPNFWVQRSVQDPRGSFAIWEEVAEIFGSTGRLSYTHKTILSGQESDCVLALLAGGQTNTSPTETVRRPGRR